MERPEGEQFNISPWEPYPPPSHDELHGSFHPPGGKFPRTAGNYHQNGVFAGGDEFHHRRIGGPSDGSFGNGGFGRGGGGGLAKPQFNRKRKFSNSDCPDGRNYTKLFVGGIARMTSEEDIRRVFEKHGHIIEVVLVQDKRTSQHHEYCFVKYLSTQEADRAIAALNNNYIFPGVTDPIRVRYADGEKVRLGAAVQHKVYVNGLNKQASKEEIAEIFSCYGFVEDVYLMYDDFKQSRGCGFVGFSQREMAVAAINGLNGTYVMRGCDQPLVVRFADPKKPKNHELRPPPDSRDFCGSMAPGASHFGNSCAPPYENAPFMGPGALAPFENPLHTPSSTVIHQPIEWQAVSPPHSFQMPLPRGQPFNGESQALSQAERQQQIASNLNNGNPVQLRDSGVAHNQSLYIRSESQTLLRGSVETNGAASSSQSASSPGGRCESVEGAPDCDWSEHICPDGHKYYYNCMTYESRWEKPEEFLLYEEEQMLKQEQKLQKLRSSGSEVPCGEESHQSQSMEYRWQSSQPENQKEPVSCAEDRSHENLTADANPAVISSALVQQVV